MFLGSVTFTIYWRHMISVNIVLDLTSRSSIASHATSQYSTNITQYTTLRHARNRYHMLRDVTVHDVRHARHWRHINQPAQYTIYNIASKIFWPPEELTF